MYYCFCLVGMLLVLLFGVSIAPAHDWYPRECCSGQDCSEIDPARVREVLGGYWIDQPTFFVLRQYARPSPDGKYHLCLNPRTAQRLRCFFAPFPGT